MAHLQNPHVRLIKLFLPDLRELLADIRAEHGYLRLPHQLCNFLTGFESSSWARVYEDKTFLGAAFVRAFFDTGSINELAEWVRSLSPADLVAARTQFAEEVIAEAEAEGGCPFAVDVSGGESLEASQASWAALSESDQKASIHSASLYFLFLLPTLFNSLAVMSFGRSMVDLVRLAKEGDDTALCNAVQVDRTVLFGISYFRQRLIRAQLEADRPFLTSLGEAIKGPVLRRKLSYPELMLVFALLDDEGLLDMPLDQLLDVCEYLDVYGREYGVEDTESLRKRRQYFRRLAGRQKAI